MTTMATLHELEWAEPKVKQCKLSKALQGKLPVYKGEKGKKRHCSSSIGFSSTSSTSSACSTRQCHGSHKSQQCANAAEARCWLWIVTLASPRLFQPWKMGWLISWPTTLTSTCFSRPMTTMMTMTMMWHMSMHVIGLRASPATMEFVVCLCACWCWREQWCSSHAGALAMKQKVRCENLCLVLTRHGV